jgi:hypothetical protein
VRVAAFVQAHRNRLRAHPFPACAPDVNPTAQVGRRLKYVELRNLCPKDEAELAAEARAGMERIRRRPELFRSFFAHSGLSLSPKRD